MKLKLASLLTYHSWLLHIVDVQVWHGKIVCSHLFASRISLTPEHSTLSFRVDAAIISLLISTGSHCIMSR